MPRKATSQTDSFEGIIAMDVMLQGDAKRLDTKQPTKGTAKIDISTNEGLVITEITTQAETGEDVVEVSASETIAKKEVEGKPTVLSEEVLPLESHDTFAEVGMKMGQGQLGYFETSHGLIVTEQKSTGNLGSLTEDKPVTKTVKVVMDDISSSIQICEVLPHETEGKFSQIEIILPSR